jgi:hypothetical protein
MMALLPVSSSAFSIRSVPTSFTASVRQLRMATDDENAGFRQAVLDDASEALQSVGWSRPSDDAELTSEDPFVKSIDASIQAEMGVGLDELLNPAKVSFSF